MKLSTFATIASVAAAFSAIAFIFFPAQLLNVYGVKLEIVGILMARSNGTALLGYAITYWMNRNIPSSDKSWFGIQISGVVFNALATIITVISITDGTANSLAWSTAAIHLFFCLGNAYFVFKKTA